MNQFMHRVSGSAWKTASLLAAVFYVLYLGFFRAGYWMNDDVKIIWNVVGYPGGLPLTPFMIHSNVLLGFLLARLYSLPTAVNWYIVLLTAINVVSVGALLYCVLASTVSSYSKIVGAAVVLIVAATLTLNFTYTVTAVLANLAGLCLVLTGAVPNAARWKWQSIAGAALLFIGTLVRLRALGVVLVFGLPGLAFVFRKLDSRRLIMGSAAACMLVLAGYAVNRIYVRLAPDWNAFYAFNGIREQLHDSHRLSNLHNQIRRVGWTPNDQELFAHWFYPDKQLYSFENVSYLVENTQGTSQDLSGSVSDFIRTLLVPVLAPLLIVALAIAVWSRRGPTSTGATLMAVVVWSAALAENLFLTWYYKDPDYVLVSTVAASLVYSWVLLSLSAGGRSGAVAESAPALEWKRISQALPVLLVGLAAALSLIDSGRISGMNVAKQMDYQRMESDLKNLQLSGTIAKDALIISPAHGLPYEWSNPYRLDQPPVDYLDTGWLTFSPTYQEILQNFGIVSLPDALYEKGNLYLMTKSSFTVFLHRYYLEHEGASVQFVPIYAMPNPHGVDGYDDVYLFKVVRSE